MNPTEGDTDMIRVVLADANVLYSRVLRDYLLYAADEEIIAVAWSPQILTEVTEHLREKVPDFDAAAASRLVSAMNRAFPFAEVEPSEENFRQLAGLQLPDEDDRHVLAAALAAEANAGRRGSTAMTSGGDWRSRVGYAVKSNSLSLAPARKASHSARV